MDSRWRMALLALVSLVWVALAYQPLAGAGFMGDDLGVLARAGGWHLPNLPSEPDRHGRDYDLDRPARGPTDFKARQFLRIAGNEGSFLSGISLATSHWLYGATGERPFGLSPALPYRVENLLLLLAAALGLWRFLRRLLLPWTGSEHARLAGWAAALAFAVHPLCVPAVASLEGRADLLALAFGTWSAALFLRARQDRSFGVMFAAAFLALAAGASGHHALVLPFALAFAEAASAHRYRPLRARVRTTLNTFGVFFAIVSINGVAIASVTGHSYLPEVWLGLLRLSEPGAFWNALSWLPGKIGLALVPANVSVLGVLGAVLGGVLLLGALQPALAAARTAPRLWGSVLGWWLAAFAIALLYGLDAYQEAEELSAARPLLPAALVAAAGLGTAATALTGVRRTLLPVGLGFGLAVLASGNAQPWKRASLTLEDLRTAAAEARAEFGREGPLVLIDPPRDVRGLDPLGDGLPWLLHPAFSGQVGEVRPLEVHEFSERAWVLFQRHPEAGELRADGPLVLWRGGAVGDGAAGQYRALRLAAPEPSRGARLWTAGDPPAGLDVEPGEYSLLELRVEGAFAGLDGARPVVRWRGSRAQLGEGQVQGGYVPSAAPSPGTVGTWRFDLGQHPAWGLGGRIESLVVEPEPPASALLELRPDLPTFAVEAHVYGADLRFSGIEPQGLSWYLELLHPASGRLATFELSPVSAADGSLWRAPGAAHWMRGVRARGKGPFLWTLEERVDGLPWRRTIGRLE